MTNHDSSYLQGKKHMKILLGVILLLFVCFNTTVHADDASHRAAIQEMLALSNVDKIMEPMFAQVENIMEQQFYSMNVSEDQKPILKKYTQKIIDLMKAELSWDKLQNDFVEIYAKVYTEAEIKEIVAFYKSPTGRKVLDKMPQLMQESITISQKNMEKILPRMEAISQEMAAEIRELDKKKTAGQK